MRIPVPLLILCACVCFIPKGLTSFWDVVEEEDPETSDPFDDYGSLPELPVDDPTVYTYNQPYPPREITIVVPKNTEAPVENEATETPNLVEKPTDPAKVDLLVSLLKVQDIRIKALEDLVKKLVDKSDDVEEHTKVNNVIFTNVREIKNESHRATLHKVLQVINGVMKVKTKAEEISVALRVDSNSSTVIRPILVTFTNFATKMRVLAAKNKLASSNIEVSADYSEKVSQRRKDLLPFLEEKRVQGHHAFILYDKLVVDGVKLTLEDLVKEKEHEETTEGWKRYQHATNKEHPCKHSDAVEDFEDVGMFQDQGFFDEHW